jgi:hypothetical protein
MLQDMLEHGHQKCLFDWAWLARKRHPELDMLVAIPNGGLRDKVVAARLRDEGVKAGFPDLMLNVPRGGYHGLFIELKTLKGRASVGQALWLLNLSAAGNRAVVCHGWLEAKTEIENYLNGRLND